MALKFQQVRDSEPRASLSRDPVADVPFQSEQPIAAMLAQAEQLIGHDEAAAAFVLDSLPRQIIGQWYHRRQRKAPRADQVLADLEEADVAIAWQLRHAMRAPEAQARIRHLRVLLRMVSS